MSKWPKSAFTTVVSVSDDMMFGAQYLGIR